MKIVVSLVLVMILNGYSEAGYWRTKITKIEKWHGDNTEVTVDIESTIEWSQNAILTVECYDSSGNWTGKGVKDTGYRLYHGKSQSIVTVPVNVNKCREASATIKFK